MSKEEVHIKQIKELVKAYGEPLIAELLEVSTRTIRNYTNEQKPTYPHDGTARKLQEIYSRHQKGLPVVSENKRAILDVNQEIVALLKDNIELLKTQVREKDRQIEEQKQLISSLRTYINSAVDELKRQQVELHNLSLELQKGEIINRSFLKTTLQVLARIIANQEKKTVEKIHSEIGTLLGEVQTGAS